MSLAVPTDDRDDHSVSSASPLQPTGFPVTPEELTALHDPKSLRKLHELGGLEHLASNLQSDISLGLHGGDNEDRVARYGRNRLPTKTAKSFFVLCFEAMKDKVLILLTVAAVISLALGLYETFGQGPEYDDEHKPMPKVDWVEGVAIITAVVIVVVVGAANDYQKERQFAKLNSKKEDREIVVFRNGDKHMVSIYDLLVGDVISLETGDVVPADSVMISGDVECDESALTGESNTIKKKPANDAMAFYEQHLSSDEDLGSTKIKFKDPFLISGAKILSGVGTALVTAVGSNSIHGRTMASLNSEAEVTPLQARLDNLAEGISKYGFLAALVLFVVLFIRFCVNIAPGGALSAATGAEKGKNFVDILIVAVTIVVVAVPEGLPLAVTLALAFATTRMAQNGNLVRVLRSCEIMGGATAICSDKTGTLTENRMRIVRGYINKTLSFDDSHHSGMTETIAKSVDMVTQIPSRLKVFICSNITINSTAFENSDYDEALALRTQEKPKQRSFFYHLTHSSQKNNQSLGVSNEPYLGNKTESALLIFAKEKFNQFTGSSLTEQRNDLSSEVVQIIPFESSRKWAGVVVKIENGYRFYVKGAAEIIFRHCTFQQDENDKTFSMDRTDREAVLEKIDEYANDALRAIMLAHKDFVGVTSWPPSEIADPHNSRQALPESLVDISASRHDSTANLVMDFLVGLQDPLKDGVAEAVMKCKMAGVTVRMVTGDNLTTAKAISRGCNILTPEDSSNENAYMEGPAFRALSQGERNRIAPMLRVLARSSPEDKRILVDTLRKAGEVVAVTGDGTNDAPALKLADVGFSMGISGTEVAREASDIILMTDDFTDIVQAIKWGRTVAESIKKFIQFQLTVNITACVLTFVSAVASTEGHSVLTAVQLLWVNLIMDTLAALALATDKPDDALLNRKPAGRTMPLISVSMWKMIIGQSINQLIITFVLHFAGQQIFYGSGPIDNHQQKQLDAMTFNAFVWLQFWKLFVTRKLDECADVTTVRGRINKENLNFFSHLFRNWYFVAIAVLIGGMQVLIMFVGGAAFTIARQTPAMWGTAIICGMVSIPVGVLIRIIPNWWVVKIFPTRAFTAFIYYVGFGWLSKKARKERASRDLEKDIESSDEEAGDPGTLSESKEPTTA
ncbi:hypothetical protein OY671_000770 [Metschnikowia pulcherrima]|nr:hypothetical protein OY671_000770 [Metschnikowia pulcherrima]